MSSTNRGKGPPGGSRPALAVAFLVLLSPGCVLTRDMLWGPEVHPVSKPLPGAAEGPGPLAEAGPDSRGRDPAVRPTEAREGPEPPGEPVADVPQPLGSRAPAVPPEPPAPAVAIQGPVYPIDLPTALRLAEAENPRIAEARAVVGIALAEQQGARALMLPSLNLGTNYHGHTGNLQRSSGRILSLSEQSLYVGGGARTLAAESVGIPAVNIVAPLGEVVFEPLAARQRVVLTQFEATATANQVLLEVAELYLELLGAEAALEAQRQSEVEANELASLTARYATAGLERVADANRAGTEDRLRRIELQRAEEELAVASARLVRRLHLEPTVRVHPRAGPLAPIVLVDPGPGPEALIRTALSRRPELGARNAAVAVAETRVRQEIARPLLPFIWVGYSGGVFGGGSNLVPPLVGNFGGRTDFDVRAYWTFQNLGLGNLAAQKRRRAQVGQAATERSRVAAEIGREVMEAYSRTLARREQYAVSIRELRTAEEGFREDLTRIKGAVGLPIEATNSLDLLADARQNLIRVLVELDQAQFDLFVALGSPPPPGPPPAGPQPAPPLACPPASPRPPASPPPSPRAAR